MTVQPLGAPSIDARCPGQSVQDVLREEAKTQPVPAALLEESPKFLGSEDLDVERYTSHEFHRQEVEKVWRKVWQMACREEDIPEVGDVIVYDVAEHSIIVVRTAENEIKAYHNSCLHRGRQLRTEDGSVPFFRCPYHAWSWNLDGTLRSMPAQWDFAHVDPASCKLPECKVGTWGGFVFINMDENAEPLDDYLGVLKEHFAQWAVPLDQRFKAAHVAGIVECNWKALMEAFIEGYHGPSTHPQMAFYAGDLNTQYDVYDAHVNRMITLEGVPSPHLQYGVEPSEIVRAFSQDMAIGDPDAITIPEGKSARDVLGDVMRELMSKATGRDLSNVSNAEFLEGTEYFLFPNFVPWGGLIPNVYRVRPYGDDPNVSIIDIMLLMPVPEGQPRPAPAKMRVLEQRNPDWRDAPELGVLGQVFNQDMQNLPFVQKGMKASRTGKLKLANYQEVRIRHYHQTLDRYIQR